MGPVRDRRLPGVGDVTVPRMASVKRSTPGVATRCQDGDDIANWTGPARPTLGRMSKWQTLPLAPGGASHALGAVTSSVSAGGF